MTLYLTDSSIWISTRRGRATYLRSLFATRMERDEIATCAPVALEVLVGPATGEALEAEWSAHWERIHWLPLREEAARRALVVQRGVAHTTAGAHRRGPIDYLVAACAEAAGEEVILWHWDSDLTAICEYTGQPHEPEHERARTYGIQLD